MDLDGIWYAVSFVGLMNLILIVARPVSIQAREANMMILC